MEQDNVRAEAPPKGKRKKCLSGWMRAAHNVCRSLYSAGAVRVVCRSLFFIFIIFLCALFFPGKACAANVRVVIDPGHGGTDDGAKYGNYTEKYMNMVVAKAMAEELQKYEGIEVFLTRTEDVDMSLQERADYAKSVGADFLFCIHFNASEEHNMYGAEVWCSAFGNDYKKGRVFGEMCLDELCSLGIYRRGVKMRLSEQDEDADYYGIIRHCVENNVTACIIEHCHLDNKEDEQYFNTSAGMKKLGALDATAVAKYYGLSSKETGDDYKNYPKPDIDSLPKMDATAPEASLTCLRVKKDAGEAELLLTGEDEESGILYYAYSMDGGESYSSLKRWEEDTDMLELDLKLPKDRDVDLLYRVYNGYDLCTETETIHISASGGKAEKKADAEDSVETMAGAADDSEGITGIGQGDADGSGAADGSDGGDDGTGSGAGNGAKGTGDISSNGIYAQDETKEAVHPDSAHVIDMSQYAEKDGEDGEKAALTDADFSDIMWFLVLGLLLALLVVLVPVRMAAVKKQKKAGYKGRKQ